jgi:hypothetical protein
VGISAELLGADPAATTLSEADISTQTALDGLPPSPVKPRMYENEALLSAPVFLQTGPGVEIKFTVTGSQGEHSHKVQEASPTHRVSEGPGAWARAGFRFVAW